MSDQKPENPEISGDGWGWLVNAKQAHYFVDGRSLCRKWLALTGFDRESNQQSGPMPSRGGDTCMGCWKKRTAQEATASEREKSNE